MLQQLTCPLRLLAEPCVCLQHSGSHCRLVSATWYPSSLGGMIMSVKQTPTKISCRYACVVGLRKELCICMCIDAHLQAQLIKRDCTSAGPCYVYALCAQLLPPRCGPGCQVPVCQLPRRDGTCSSQITLSHCRIERVPLLVLVVSAVHA